MAVPKRRASKKPARERPEFGSAELEETRTRLIELLTSYLDSATPAAEVRDAAAAIREAIRASAAEDGWIADADLANLRDLLEELSDATSFGQGRRDAVQLIRAILESGLTDADESDEWAALVQLRGPIQAMWRYECEDCSFAFPVCGLGAFVELFNGVCEACGEIGFFKVSDERLAELQRRYDEEFGDGWGDDPRREAEFWEDVAEALPRCSCGAPYAFYFAHQAPFAVAEEFCPKCGSPDVKAQPLSRYAYFGDHDFVIHG
jgi:hypothetical protein